jgi:hypothetical protein
MTVRLLKPYAQRPANSLATFDASVEAGLIAANKASTDLTGGFKYFVPRPGLALQSKQIAVGSVTLKTEEQTTVLLPEGQVLLVTGAASTVGAVARTGSSDTWIVGTGALAQIGPYAGLQKFSLTCDSGSVAAKVQDATLGLTGAAVATITGSFQVGQTITASLPPGMIGTLQFTRTLTSAPFTKSNIAGAVANAVSSLSYTLQPEDGGYSVDCDSSAVVSTSKGGVVPGFPAVTISASIRTQMPVTAGQFGTSPEQNWRVNDTALKPATNPRGFFTNNAVWASVDGPQEIANISPVIVTLPYLTGVDGTGNADQSASTIAPPTWSNAANGVADYLFKDANLTPATAAEFVAAGGFISSDGYSIKFPPWLVWLARSHDRRGAERWLCCEFCPAGAAPVDLDDYERRHLCCR